MKLCGYRLPSPNGNGIGEVRYWLPLQVTNYNDGTSIDIEQNPSTKRRHWQRMTRDVIACPAVGVIAMLARESNSERNSTLTTQLLCQLRQIRQYMSARSLQPIYRPSSADCIQHQSPTMSRTSDINGKLALVTGASGG